MKKISVPVMPYELNEESFNHDFSDGSAAALFFADETGEKEMTGFRFDECRFKNITFHPEMDRCLFADCIFERCDFSNCSFNEAVFRRCQFKSCRMTGTDFSYSRFDDVSMTGCESSYANYARARFKICSIEECRFTEASFNFCTFEDLKISRCGFASAEFMETKLKGLDFSDSDISGIMTGIRELKGVTLNEQQALACARMIGILVKE